MHEAAAHIRTPLQTVGYFRSFWALTFYNSETREKGKGTEGCHRSCELVTELLNRGPARSPGSSHGAHAQAVTG